MMARMKTIYRKLLLSAILPACALLPSACGGKSDYDKIREGFTTLPDSIQTSVY